VPAIIASVVQLVLCGIAALVSYGPGETAVGEGTPAPTTTAPSTGSGPSTSSGPSPTPSPTEAAPISASATTPAATSSSKARVDTFKITRTPVCAPTGTGGAFAGQVVLQWTVGGGATGSQLFTDGVLFDTFGPSQTVTLAFACDGNPGDTVTHTYTVKTLGAGSQATKSLTASATIPR
jgi:hypothetical protein